MSGGLRCAAFVCVESSGDTTESLGELSRIVQYLPAAVVPDDVPGARMPIEIDWSVVLEFIARRDADLAVGRRFTVAVFDENDKSRLGLGRTVMYDGVPASIEGVAVEVEVDRPVRVPQGLKL